MDSASRESIAKFIALLDSSEAWLDMHFDRTDLPENVIGLVKSLRGYLGLCRRRVWRGRITDAQISRWRRKIQGACVALWAIARGRS